MTQDIYWQDSQFHSNAIQPFQDLDKIFLEGQNKKPTHSLASTDSMKYKHKPAQKKGDSYQLLKGQAYGTNVIDLSKHRHLTVVKFAWKSNLLDEINGLYLPENLPEDTILLPNALLNAKQFIEGLPLQIDGPTLSVEANGSILLEWYTDKSGQATIFSVVFDGKGILFSLFKAGKRTNNYGHLNFCEESIARILPDITQNFGISDGHRLKA